MGFVTALVVLWILKVTIAIIMNPPKKNDSDVSQNEGS